MVGVVVVMMVEVMMVVVALKLNPHPAEAVETSTTSIWGCSSSSS